MKTFLLVGSPSDDHIAPVAEALRARGHRAVVLSLADLPARAGVAVSFEPEGFRAELRAADGELVDVSSVEAVWLRRIATPDPDRSILDRPFAIAEVHHLLVGLAMALRDRVRWVNPVSALALDGGWGKIRQLDVARAVGLEIPRTVATNETLRARDFVGSCPGGAIYKPFACPEGLWTTDVTHATAEDFHRVRHAPCIFQERIPKEADLRVTVMGDRVFAAEIRSQESEESRVDYRRKCYTLERRPHALPGVVAQRLVALHRSLGLEFGTSDFILRPDGGYTFLEVNQAGMFLEVGEAPGLSLLGPFVDFLEGGV